MKEIHYGDLVYSGDVALPFTAKLEYDGPIHIESLRKHSYYLCTGLSQGKLCLFGLTTKRTVVIDLWETFPTLWECWKDIEVFSMEE